MKRFSLLAAVAAGILGLSACGPRQVVYPAPPMNQPISAAPPMGGGPMGGGQMASAPGQGVYNWLDVPQGQQVPINRAVFDQGGYQLYAATGETIVVPFANQNLYVMKFGLSNGGGNYFVNEGDAPVLYLQRGGFLENAAAQGARWYPIPDGYAYSRPMYVSLAPTWQDYTGMGWYSGMNYYGGMYGYSPRAAFTWMPNFYVSIGGHRYNDYGSYRTYYTRTPGYIRNRVVYNNYTTRGTGSFGTGRSFNNGSTGSFRPGNRGPFSGSNGSTGSFGTGGSRNMGGTGSFGTGGGTRSFNNGSTGSFGTGSAPRTFNNGSSGSFSGGGSSTGSGSSGSFGRRDSGAVNTAPAPSSGSSFGGTRSTGGSSGSFGGGSRSSGGSSTGSGSSFGGGRSSGSSSGSFGGGRSSGGSRRR